jgi:hypothetical protein
MLGQPLNYSASFISKMGVKRFAHSLEELNTITEFCKHNSCEAFFSPFFEKNQLLPQVIFFQREWMKIHIMFSNFSKK